MKRLVLVLHNSQKLPHRSIFMKREVFVVIGQEGEGGSGEGGGGGDIQQRGGMR